MKEKILNIAILVFIAVVFYNVFMAPQGKELKALNSQYVSGKELLKVRHNKEDELEESRRNNQKLRNELSSLEDKLLKRDKVNLFLQRLSKAAAETNNKLLAIEPRKKEEPIGEIVRRKFVKLSMIGGYSAVANFLGRLETGKQILNVSDITIEATRDNKAFKTSFILTLYIIEDK